MISIAQFGPKAAPAAPALVESLNDPQLRQNNDKHLTRERLTSRWERSAT
jgi:hypothetical protein